MTELQSQSGRSAADWWPCAIDWQSAYELARGIARLGEIVSRPSWQDLSQVAFDRTGNICSCSCHEAQSQSPRTSAPVGWQANTFLSGKSPSTMKHRSKSGKSKSNKRGREAGTAHRKQEEIRPKTQHETAPAESRGLPTQHAQDSKLLHFIIRGHDVPHLSGSIPCNIFEAEPNSVLNHTYNRDWMYATDDKGRACINSDPAHWPLILNWLSFGIVPSQPKEDFIAECKYWQLDELLAQLEQPATIREPHNTISNSTHTLSLVPVYPVHETGWTCFVLKGHIFDFVQRSGRKELTTNGTCFKAFGIVWRLHIGAGGLEVLASDGPAYQAARVEISLGSGTGVFSITNGNIIAKPSTNHFSWVASWPVHGWERVQSFPCIDFTGSLPVMLSVLFPPKYWEQT
ncbi:hypothetical protein WJX74_010957 [Apatococcus lobatus]|uniref:Uncharacterized protein n=1 Tax=Apatococcus lobatus TaxID=904363 RepID=A0AAW1Q911_9CHLO